MPDPDRFCPRCLLERRRRDAAEAVAFVEGSSGRTLTWGDIASALPGWDEARARLGDGARVGLLLADPLEMIRSYLAALAAGVVLAPLDPGSTAPEVSRAVRRLGLAAVVTDAETSGVAGDVDSAERWQATPAGPAPAAPATGGSSRPAPAPAGNGPAPVEAALILASSGTTGEPKIIPVTRDQLMFTAVAIAGGHGLGGDDIGYSPLPLFHINGLVVGVLSTLVTGGRLVVERRFSARRFWDTAAAHRVTWVNLVPAIITVLSEREAPPAEVASGVRFARSASAPLLAATRERFEAHCGITVLETYGMTEAASQIAANPLDPAERRPGSVGLPVDVELRVADRQGHPMPAGEVGHVHIRGRRVTSQYWGPADTDAGATVRDATGDGGWLATGDLGWLDEDGYVYLVGRVDDVINRGGEKVFPREVEEVLLRDPAVSAAAVVGRPHPTVGEEPVAFVLAGVDGAEGEALAGRLARRCQAELSRFKRPADIVVADSLPSGPTGKIRHSALRKQVVAAARATYDRCGHGGGDGR